MKKLLLSVVIIAVAYFSKAQNTFPSIGAVGIGTTTPAASALLDVTSTSKGFLVPRIVLKQRILIAKPATGLLVYQTDGDAGFYYYSLSGWLKIASTNNEWSLTGNNGTNASNFLGTTDSAALTFKVNNKQAGYIEYGKTRNTGFGYETLSANLGNINTAFGYNSLPIVTGEGNTAVGSQILQLDTTGSWNTGMGAFALEENTTGSNNTGIGVSALITNTTGSDNTAVGFWSFCSATGNDNTGIGFNTLADNSSGSFNTAVGSMALYTTQASDNTAIGYQALNGNTLGSSNTAIGYQALNSNTTGQYITALGHSANVSSNNLFNATAVGSSALATASNQVRIGDNYVTSIGGYVGWSNVSDGRVKKNIKQNVPGLVFINKLEPVTYNFDLDAADKIIQYQRKDSTGKIIPLTQVETDARKAKEQIVYTGFIAQDVEKAAKSLTYDFSGVDAAKNSKDLYGLRYAEFVVPLVKGEQELSKENDSLMSIVNSLQDQINQLKAMIVSSTNSNQSSFISSASLAQNIPNPFSNSTSINYTLPQNYSSANIMVTDAKGVVLKQINLHTKGNATVQLDASTLAAGAYRYSLYVDGKIVDSKQMISSK